jgi:hypothetical protein
MASVVAAERCEDPVVAGHSRSDRSACVDIFGRSPGKAPVAPDVGPDVAAISGMAASLVARSRGVLRAG